MITKYGYYLITKCGYCLITNFRYCLITNFRHCLITNFRYCLIINCRCNKNVCFFNLCRCDKEHVISRNLQNCLIESLSTLSAPLLAEIYFTHGTTSTKLVPYCC